MAEKNTIIVTAEDKEMRSERDDEMRAKNDDIEVRWKQMQDKMNEMELKVNNMDQLTKDLDGVKASLHVQTERLNDCDRQLKEGLSVMKMVPMLEEMREEMEKMQVEPTRLAQKANNDSEVIHTVQGRAEAFIQMLEQKDEKTEKKLNEHKTDINTMMDAYKTQIEDVKTTIASMDTGSERQHRALEQMESKLLEMINDLQKQYEWLTIMKQFSNDERRQETEQAELKNVDANDKKVDPVALFGTLSQRDGCLVSEFNFTVKNIGEEINKAKYDESHCIESQPFYTNIKGYRAKIQVYPNESKSNHVGVYLSLVKGEFDESVSWPFICKYEFSSVGRDGNQFASFYVNPDVKKYISSFWRPQNKSNIPFGAAEYVKIRKLLVNKDKYLIDGGLKIKTTIWLDN